MSSSTPDIAAHESLSRYSLLAYFLKPHHAYPSNGSIEDVERSPRLSPIQDEDTRGFWGESIEGEEEGKDASWGAEDVLCAVVYALMIMIVVVSSDTLMARWGFAIGGKGGASGVGDGVVEVRNLLYPVIKAVCANTFWEMHFCLVQQQTVFPGPRTWRFVLLDSLGECNSEILTLGTKTMEASKLKIGDEMLFSGVDGLKCHDENESKFLEGGAQQEGKPDDLAEEGISENPVGNSMHAGFGGPWSRI